MRILHLTLKRHWFDMIHSGDKREEYRELKPYWHRRLNKTYDAIQFRNGYAKNSPTMLVELKEILVGLGIQEWGAPTETRVYILKLGQVLESTNTEKVGE